MNLTTLSTDKLDFGIIRQNFYTASNLKRSLS